MEINVLEVLVEKGGKPYQQNGENFTLKEALLLALDAPSSQGVDARQAVKRRRLFIRIDNATGPVTFAMEEIMLLKELVSQTLRPLIAGQVLLMLDPTFE